MVVGYGNQPYEIHQETMTSKQLLQLHVQPPSMWDKILCTHTSSHQLLPYP